MQIGVLKETFPGEKRVALLPASIAKLLKTKASVSVETGLGATLSVADDDYKQAGAQVASRQNILAQSDILLRIRKPAIDEIKFFKKNAIHISLLDPFNERELITRFASSGISAISMEMIPRSTIAQKMDVLSSQANLAGYTAVIIAAERLDKILPMMMTPAGTLTPARVFVIGAGVAGLQAIATAKRLGARVEAFDTRPVVEEQVRSLGAKFIQIDLGETGQTKDGYAKALTNEQLNIQRDAMTKVCAQSDIIITTAQVFGRQAPRIITKEIIAQMKPGSIIVDMAAESGGNVEGTLLDQEILIDGVRVVGLGNLSSRVARDASAMLANNYTAFLETFLDNEAGTFKIDLSHEILKGCLITHQGQIVNDVIKNLNP